MLGRTLLEKLYIEAEKEDGYFRDQSVFSDGISIEDTMSVLVKYDNRAMLTYSLNAYMPWEGFRVSINGSKGRIEMEVVEKAYSKDGKPADVGVVKGESITVYPMFEAPYKVNVEKKEGGHGGADPILLNDLFGTPEADPLNRASSYIDGAMSILTGVAANRSLETGLPVNINDLVKF